MMRSRRGRVPRLCGWGGRGGRRWRGGGSLGLDLEIGLVFLFYSDSCLMSLAHEIGSGIDAVDKYPPSPRPDTFETKKKKRRASL